MGRRGVAQHTAVAVKQLVGEPGGLETLCKVVAVGYHPGTERGIGEHAVDSLGQCLRIVGVYVDAGGAACL